MKGLTEKDIREMNGGQMPTFLAEDPKRRERWKHLTEGLDKKNRLMVENLMENTRKWIAFETSQKRDVGTFTTYAFPLIRRVFPNMKAQELVSVQPIPQPTAKIFYYDLKYGTAIKNVNVGDRIDLQANFNSYYGGGKVIGDLIGTGDGTEDTFDASYAPIDEDTLVVYVDGTEVDVNDGASDFDAGEIVLDSAPASGAAVTADYTVKGAEESADPRELDFEITDDSVEAESKKLQTKWTLEAQQDLMAYHGLDAESELLAGMSDALRREIDRIIVQDLLDNATAGSVNWTKSVPAEYDGSEREWRMTLYDAILDANNKIYKKRYRNANWIVADPDTCTELEKLDGFSEMKDSWTGQSGMGLEEFGILRNRFKVYKDPWFESNTMLLGYKGATMFETGYVYAPYIPMYVTPTIMDTNFEPRRAVMSRYARKPVITDYYSKVNIVT